MSTTPNSRQKIERVEIKNFQKIEHEELDLRGRHVYVTGGNEAGKSSVLRAIFSVLSKALPKGLTADKPTEMVRHGAKKAEVTIELTDYKVSATIRNKAAGKVELEVVGPDGEAMKAPRSVLDELLGVVDFDVKGFFNLPDAEKVNRIKAMAGLDFSDLDAQREKLMKDRKEINSILKVLEAQQPTYDKTLATAEPMSTDEVATLQEKEREALAKYDKTLNAINQMRADKVNLEITNGNIEKEIDQLLQRVEELQNEKTTNEGIIETLAERVTNGEKWQEATPRPQLTDISETLRTITEHNEKIRVAKEAQERGKQISANVKLADQLTDSIADIDEQKRQRLEQHPLPVPGLTFEEDKLVLKGVEFTASNVNTATQIIAGLQLQLPMMQQAGFVRLDASLLDLDSRKIVQDWCDANGLQMFAELVEVDPAKKALQFLILSEDVSEVPMEISQN